MEVIIYVDKDGNLDPDLSLEEVAEYERQGVVYTYRQQRKGVISDGKLDSRRSEATGSIHPKSKVGRHGRSAVRQSGSQR